MELLPTHRFAALLKESAAFAPPPQLVKDIYEWGRIVIAYRLYPRVLAEIKQVKEGPPPEFGDPNAELIELFQLKRELERIMATNTAKGKPDFGIPRKMIIDTRGWKYLPLLEQRGNKERMNYPVTVVVDGAKGPSGYWDLNRSLIKVNSTVDHMWLLTVKEFNRELDRFYATVEHEATHAAQTYMRLVLGLPRIPGMTSPNLQDHRYNYQGVPKPGNWGAEDAPHPLREVEFKTNLGSAVREFLHLSNRIPRHSLREAIQVYTQGNPSSATYSPDGNVSVKVYQSPIFKGLQSDMPKWRQAVSEFYDALNRAGLPV